jgi:hypothetical protein
MTSNSSILRSTRPRHSRNWFARTFLYKKRIRFQDNIRIRIINYSEEEKRGKLQVVRQLSTIWEDSEDIAILAEESLSKVKQTCNTSAFRHDIIPVSLYEENVTFENVVEDDVSTPYQPIIAPKKAGKSNSKRNFKPRRSARLLGQKCTRSGRRYGS